MGHLYVAGDADIWPENWATYTAYRRVCDQWIVGPGGLVGMNLCAVYPLLDRTFPDHTAWLRALDDIRAMAEAVAEDLRSD